jgi:glucosamine-6-phosphate deaminase
MRPQFAPRLIVAVDAAAAAAMAADRVAGALRERRVLGLATGATMRPLYDELARRLSQTPVANDGVVGIALDEFVGLPAGHPASFSTYLDRAFRHPLRLRPDQIVVPDGTAANRRGAAARHEAAIADAGRIDLQLLGIGANGHIGFNEPGSPFDSRTRDVALAEETRRAQAGIFGSAEAVPGTAITAGVATILSARSLLMLVTGESKAKALAQMLEGDVGPHVPASALRLHPDAVIICDGAAASALQDRDAVERMIETC